MNYNEAQLLARVQWEVSAERLSLELTPPAGDEWDQRPRDLEAAVQLAEAALEAVKAAFGLGENDATGSGQSHADGPRAVDASATSAVL